jgi:hypothetical protein
VLSSAFFSSRPWGSPQACKYSRNIAYNYVSRAFKLQLSEALDEIEQNPT